MRCWTGQRPPCCQGNPGHRADRNPSAAPPQLDQMCSSWYKGARHHGGHLATWGSAAQVSGGCVARESRFILPKGTLRISPGLPWAVSLRTSPSGDSPVSACFPLNLQVVTPGSHPCLVQSPASPHEHRVHPWRGCHSVPLTSGCCTSSCKETTKTPTGNRIRFSP